MWNVDDLCNTSLNEGGISGFEWCALTGAGGGGNSQFWGRPIYQYGPGITNPYTTYGNGTTQCSLAALGKPCREVPDVSANADEYTPCAEYCTGSIATPLQHLRYYQRNTAWLVRHRRHQPIIAIVVGDHR